MTCGECGQRLIFHYKYPDVKRESRYSRCSQRPELKQKNNSCPIWCPMGYTKETSKEETNKGW